MGAEKWVRDVSCFLDSVSKVSLLPVSWGQVLCALRWRYGSGHLAFSSAAVQLADKFKICFLSLHNVWPILYGKDIGPVFSIPWLGVLSQGSHPLTSLWVCLKAGAATFWLSMAVTQALGCPFCLHWVDLPSFSFTMQRVFWHLVLTRSVPRHG